MAILEPASSLSDAEKCLPASNVTPSLPCPPPFALPYLFPPLLPPNSHFFFLPSFFCSLSPRLFSAHLPHFQAKTFVPPPPHLATQCNISLIEKLAACRQQTLFKQTFWCFCQYIIFLAFCTSPNSWPMLDQSSIPVQFLCNCPTLRCWKKLHHLAILHCNWCFIAL